MVFIIRVGYNCSVFHFIQKVQKSKVLVLNTLVEVVTTLSPTGSVSIIFSLVLPITLGIIFGVITFCILTLTLGALFGIKYRHRWTKKNDICHDEIEVGPRTSNKEPQPVPNTEAQGDEVSHDYEEIEYEMDNIESNNNVSYGVIHSSNM